MGFNYVPHPYCISLPVGSSTLAAVTGNGVVCSFALTVTDVTGGAVVVTDSGGNVATLDVDMVIQYGLMDQRQINTEDFTIVVPDGSKAVLVWEM